MLSDIKGVLIHQDDVFIFAENKKALDKTFLAVRTRQFEKPVTVNKKTQLNIVQNGVFLGFKISDCEDQSHAVDKLVRRIREISKLEYMKEQEYFVGLEQCFSNCGTREVQGLCPDFSLNI